VICTILKSLGCRISGFVDGALKSDVVQSWGTLKVLFPFLAKEKNSSN
jgi:hypothetical protein